MILVLNLGLKSIRAIVFDNEGRKAGSASRPLQTRLDGLRVEQEPEEWWALAAEVVRETLTHIRPEELQGMTVTASSSCLVCLGANLRPLGPAIMVSDGRDQSQRAALEGAGVVSRHVPMLSRFRWVKEEAGEMFSRVEHVVSINDFLTACLTGKLVTDPLNAEKSGWDVKAGAWDAPALAAAGLRQDMMPEVWNTGSCVGPVTTAAKSHLGLGKAKDLKVYLSSYDAISALFGSGIRGEGEACDVSGTVTSLRAVSRDRVPRGEDSEVIYEQFEATHGIYITGGSNNLGGGIIEWARQTFYAEEKHPYEVMETEAAACSPGAEGLVFLPYLLGERAPLWDANLRAAFFGIERFHDRRHFARAVFESAALGLVPLKAEIEKKTGPIKTVFASGGLSRIALINQIKADVFGVEVRVLDEFESTAFGAAILAGVNSGFFPSLEQASELVQTRSIVVPNRRNRNAYAVLSGFYNELLCGLAPLFRRRRDQLLPALVKEVSLVGNL